MRTCSWTSQPVLSEPTDLLHSPTGLAHPWSLGVSSIRELFLIRQRKYPLATGAFRASNRLLTRLTVGALPFIFNLFYPARAFRALFRLILGLTEKS